jgi:uncharacterized protein
MLDYKAPGVYIEEQPATGPIAGVGTSTAAFVGDALQGDVNVPVKVTNWTQFLETFGGFMTAPRSWLAYAVRGFFANGGTVAWIVRAGTAGRAFRELEDRGTTAGKALVVRAQRVGAGGNAIKVAVEDAAIVPVDSSKPALVRRASAPVTSVQATVVTLKNTADAAQFRPGDLVTVDGTARAEVSRIRDSQLILTSELPSATSGNVRIADLAVEQRTFRVENPVGIEPGSVLHLAQGTSKEEDVLVDAVSQEFVTLAGGGLAKEYSLTPSATKVDVTSAEFTLTVFGLGSTTRFEKLTMDPRHSRYFARVIDSDLVEVVRPAEPSVQLPPRNRPKPISTPASLEKGAADDPSNVEPGRYLRALEALEKVDDVSLVCVPGVTDMQVQQAVVAHCEKMKDRFAILDAAPRAPLSGDGSVVAQRAGVESARGYAALYYPWILIGDPGDPTGRDTVLAPPSGHVAGIFARSDAERGVHKAPANELVTGALALERRLDDVEQGELNIEGVNVLRVFPGRTRPVVWGARTTAPPEATAWRYVNVRRLFLFIEESIQEGIRWAVFEPNDQSLWKRLERTITEFLTRVWSSGALFGASPAEAFYVKVDAENNPSTLRELGQVVIEIGIAPVRPAEFVVVRIGMWPGGGQVTEG